MFVVIRFSSFLRTYELKMIHAKYFLEHQMTTSVWTKVSSSITFLMLSDGKFKKKFLVTSWTQSNILLSSLVIDGSHLDQFWCHFMSNSSLLVKSILYSTMFSWALIGKDAGVKGLDNAVFQTWSEHLHTSVYPPLHRWLMKDTRFRQHRSRRKVSDRSLTDQPFLFEFSKVSGNIIAICQPIVIWIIRNFYLINNVPPWEYRFFRLFWSSFFDG